VKIFYNDKEVTKTSPRPLDFIDMSIHFKKEEDAQKPEGITASPNSGLLLALKVAEVPESIRIEVYETGLLGDLIVGDLYVPVPRPGETMIAVDRETMFVEFSGRPFNRNVSSSRKTDLMLLDGDDWYSGAISLFCAWGVDETGVSLGPKRLYLTSFAV
jgi:coiled-coil and C2 domain-containing protein 2A